MPSIRAPRLGVSPYDDVEHAKTDMRGLLRSCFRGEQPRTGAGRPKEPSPDRSSPQEPANDVRAAPSIDAVVLVTPGAPLPADAENVRLKARVAELEALLHAQAPTGR